MAYKLKLAYKLAYKSGYLDATKNTTKYKALLSLISALLIVLIVAFIIYESKKTVLMLPYYIGLYDFGNEALPELTVITGISSNHYNESLDMIGSVHYHLPNTSIVVYDLGLKRHQIKMLQRLSRKRTSCSVQFFTLSALWTINEVLGVLPLENKCN